MMAQTAGDGLLTYNESRGWYVPLQAKLIRILFIYVYSLSKYKFYLDDMRQHQ